MEATIHVRDANYKREYLKKHGLEAFIRYYFLHYHGYPCSLTNPQTLSEKLQWLKLNGGLERFARYVDKYDVRAFIKERIGEDYLIPLLQVYQRAEEINFTELPERFVIKASHGSGWNEVVLDKETADLEGIREKCKEWLAANFYDVSGEPNYKPLTGKIVAEKWIGEPGADLKDYKIYCFHGEPQFIQVDSERYSGHKRNLFSLEWEPLPFRLVYPKLEEPIERPEKLTDMLAIAKELAKDFAFVRVDLYHTTKQIYFGELTFTPGSGFLAYNPTSFDHYYGSKLDLKGDSPH